MQPLTIDAWQDTAHSSLFPIIDVQCTTHDVCRTLPTTWSIVTITMKMAENTRTITCTMAHTLAAPSAVQCCI
jgi:hypothetical protein